MGVLYDVIIAGGGPAGLSAALMLGRSRRKVLVCDSERYRNQRTEGVHGFLSRDGIKPSELLRLSRGQLSAYDVEVRRCQVVRADVVASGGFRVKLADGKTENGRRLLLATGVVDHLPKIEGFEEFYGSSVHHCPYCDGWEHRDEPMAAYGPGRSAYGLALSLKTWTGDVTLCTHGRSRLSKKDRETLDLLGIGVREEKIERLEGRRGRLEKIIFGRGEPLPCRAVFFNPEQRQTCSLGNVLGCEFTRRGVIKTDKCERTQVRGVFAAGDCSRNVQWVAVAVSQGAIAAERINIELQEEDRNRTLEIARRGKSSSSVSVRDASRVRVQLSR